MYGKVARSLKRNLRRGEKQQQWRNERNDVFTKKNWKFVVFVRIECYFKVNIMPVEFPKADAMAILFMELPSKSIYIQIFEARSPKNQRVYLVVTSK